MEKKKRWLINFLYYGIFFCLGSIILYLLFKKCLIVVLSYLTAILLACKFKHKYNLINISKLPFELMLDCGKKLNTSNFVTAVLDGLRLQNMLPYVEIEQSKMNMYKGELIYNYMINIRNKSIDEYKRQFSRYISLNITPNDIFDIYSNAEKYIINKYLN